MFTDSLQPTDAQDDSNMWALSYSTKSCAVRRFTSAFAGVCKQRHSTDKLANRGTRLTSFKLHSNIMSRGKFIFLVTFLNLALTVYIKKNATNVPRWHRLARRTVHHAYPSVCAALSHFSKDCGAFTVKTRRVSPNRGALTKIAAIHFPHKSGGKP